MVVCLGYLVYSLSFCTVTDFSAAEKDSSMKLGMFVPLLSRQSSPILVNFGSRGVTAAALLPGYTNRTRETNVYKLHLGKKFRGEARWAVGIGNARRVSCMVGFASCKPADALVFLCFWFCAVDKAG